MAQGLRSLAALPDDLDWILSIHMKLLPVTSVLGV